MKVELWLLIAIHEVRVKLANDVTYKRLVSTLLQRTLGLCLRANLQDESDHGEVKETRRERLLYLGQGSVWEGFAYTCPS